MEKFTRRNTYCASQGRWLQKFIDFLLTESLCQSWVKEERKRPLEWDKVCAELHNKGMLCDIDLRLLEAYCNAISLHIETEMMLRKKGRIQVFKDEEGNIKHAQALPFQKIANDALDRALKLATQFGFTPSSRTGISSPTINIQQNNSHNYFE